MSQQTSTSVVVLKELQDRVIEVAKIREVADGQLNPAGVALLLSKREGLL